MTRYQEKTPGLQSLSIPVYKSRLGGIAYAYKLEGHESRLGRDCPYHWEGYELLFNFRRQLALEDTMQRASADTD